MNAVQPAVGLALLRRLSGFRGYPKEGGEGRFVEVLCEVSISVEHANSVVETFDGEFPALRDIRDVALNLRPKFEPKVDQRTQWEAELKAQDPNWKPEPFHVEMPTDLNPVKRREKEMYSKLRTYFSGNPDPTWEQMARAARELGYPEWADAWDRAMVR